MCLECRGEMGGINWEGGDEDGSVVRGSHWRQLVNLTLGGRLVERAYKDVHTDITRRQHLWNTFQRKIHARGYLHTDLTHHQDLWYTLQRNVNERSYEHTNIHTHTRTLVTPQNVNLH